MAKRLELGSLCFGFKGVQEEIPSEEANTLQIGSVAFPPEQYTNSQLHPCHRLYDQDARGVIVIVVGNEHGDTNSNPGRNSLHFTSH